MVVHGYGYGRVWRGWGVETKAVWQMFKCGTIQISNHLHTVEHVVQSKSEKKTYFLCVGGGGSYCFNGTKSTKGA